MELHICWYQGQGYLPMSGSNMKVIFDKKNGCFGGISVSQAMLVIFISDNKARHPSGTLEKREKFLGDVRHMVVDGNPKPDKLYLFEKLQQSQNKLQAEMRANLPNKPIYSSDSRDLHRRTDGQDLSPVDYPNSSSRRCRRDSAGRQTSKYGEFLRLGSRVSTMHIYFSVRKGGYVIM